MTKSILSLALLFAISTFCSSLLNGATQFEIHFHEHKIQVSDSTIRLGDIAKVSANSIQVRQSIEEIDIDSFDEYSQEVIISKEQVRIRLMLDGHEIDNSEIHGPDRLRVSRIERKDIRKVIEQEILHQISNQFSIPASELQVTLDINFKHKSEHVPYYDSLQVDAFANPELPLGRQNLAVVIPTGSGEIQSTSIPVSIGLYREFAIAKNDISKGKRLVAEDLESVRRLVASSSAGYLTVENAVGQQAQSAIPKYGLIRVNSVRRASNKQAPLIRRNSLVNIIVRHGNLSVTLRDAKALSDAQLGERIQVINPNNNERMSARVVDAYTVEVR